MSVFISRTLEYSRWVER